MGQALKVDSAQSADRARHAVIILHELGLDTQLRQAGATIGFAEPATRIAVADRNYTLGKHALQISLTYSKRTGPRLADFIGAVR